ncbi:hypothetical protein [Moritella sp. F3]|uniref:hypothetical protein n=1 Tax=Moritella sp. F3 TaxID=2718882 RepID=UPI0018E16774|nr:hypothetical protein [Moritella sp. F3]GIC77180.1 hypothetical protein FMO001_19070 [Moritella sp. F1]GIC82299.1 hypothetical protein FMO003_25800 [Moritella sp. F3]
MLSNEYLNTLTISEVCYIMAVAGAIAFTIPMLVASFIIALKFKMIKRTQKDPAFFFMTKPVNIIILFIIAISSAMTFQSSGRYYLSMLNAGGTATVLIGVYDTRTQVMVGEDYSKFSEESFTMYIGIEDYENFKIKLSERSNLDVESLNWKEARDAAVAFSGNM